jgi:transposase InsO family protein
MARENPPWGSERIRGELRKLGITVCNRSVRRYRSPGSPRPPSQTWRTFITNHAHAIWGTDLFVVQTLTFNTLYVLLFIAHGRRELVHLAVTAHPTAAWVWRQLVEATPWGRRPKRLIRDRDRVYGGDFQARASGLGIETVLTPVRAPRANAVAERLIGTLRRECLDHLIPVDEVYLRSILAEYAAFYNTERPHRTLRLEVPRPASRSSTGAVFARPVLGGLHYAYTRAA